jgi:type I restriction enzyme S subunit
MAEWRESTWGVEISLEYGKGIRGYADAVGPFRVFGSNGPVGWTSEALAQGPGVILGRKGAYRGVQFSKKPFFVIDTAYYVVPKSELDMRWLYYAIIYHKLGEIDDGSPIPSTTRAAVYVRELSVPQTIEQKAIASVLGAIDDKIELNRRMNETLEATARAIFKDWFVDFGPTRAKLEGRAPYLAADIRSLFPDALDGDGKPEGWSTEAVYDQAIWVNGAAYKDMHFSSEPDALPVVKIAELKSGITKTTRFTNTDLGERYKIRDGELLFSWSGNPDTSIDTFVWTSGTAWLNQHIFAVRPNGKRSQAFLYAMLKFLRSEFAEIARNKQTTGLGHVTQQDLIRLKITAPSEGAQAAFDDVVGPLHARFTSNLFENQSLIATRDFLLPKLMSGEVRVKDAEKIIGEAT